LTAVATKSAAALGAGWKIIIVWVDDTVRAKVYVFGKPIRDRIGGVLRFVRLVRSHTGGLRHLVLKCRGVDGVREVGAFRHSKMASPEAHAQGAGDGRVRRFERGVEDTNIRFTV
jgi:hypothetical protein